MSSSPNLTSPQLNRDGKFRGGAIIATAEAIFQPIRSLPWLVLRRAQGIDCSEPLFC